MPSLKSLPKPCPSCPWRTDQDAQDIPNFDLQLAERLVACCPDEQNFGPDFGAPVFGCHKSNEGDEFPCAGWLAIVGNRHPNIRLAVAAGAIPPEALAPGDDWPELHATYGEVLAKLRASYEQDED